LNRDEYLMTDDAAYDWVTVAEVIDAGAWRTLVTSVIDCEITIISVRKVPSNYSDGNYAVIKFEDVDGIPGTFAIGNNGALMPMMLARLGKLPASGMILRVVDTPRGEIFKWKRVK
jgi:hypothetical protein